MSISENIKALRDKYGLTQAELGEIAGVSDKAVSTWENGTAEPRLGAIQKLADHFHITKCEIIEDNGERPDIKLTDCEAKLLDSFRQLNEEGKEKVCAYTADLVDTGKYKKHNESQVVGE